MQNVMRPFHFLNIFVSKVVLTSKWPVECGPKEMDPLFIISPWLLLIAISEVCWDSKNEVAR